MNQNTRSFYDSQNASYESSFGMNPNMPVFGLNFPGQQACFSTPRIFHWQQRQGEAESVGESSSAGENSKRARKQRAEWTNEQSSFLLQVWTENYDYINSAHSRKAWKRLLAKMNEKFPLTRTLDQIKRKINHHVDKYKEVCDWNRNQSGGHNRECDFLDIINGVLGTRDIINFECVVGAGIENSEETEISTIDPELEESLGSASLPSSSRQSFQIYDRRVTPNNDEENPIETVADTSTPIPSEHIEQREERKKGGKARKRVAKANEDKERSDEVLDQLTKQGDALVAAVERMEENSRLQKNVLQQMTSCFSLFLEKQSKETRARASPSPRKKRQRRREESEDSDNF